MKILIIVYTLVMLILNILFCSAQATFQKMYDGYQGVRAIQIINTYDGGYCILGQTFINFTDSVDIGIFKVDNIGYLQWSVIIGTPNDEFVTGIVETLDSGFIIVGNTVKPQSVPNEDFFALKINSSGNTVMWSKLFGGSNYDEVFSIIKTPDNNYLISGATSSYGTAISSGLVLKINENGDQLWCSLSGDISIYSLNHSDLTLDQKYVIVGTSDNGIDRAVYILKLDTNGSLIWSKRYFINNLESCWYSNIKSTSDNGFIISSNIRVIPDGESKNLIVKLDSLGELIWGFVYGITFNDYAFSVLETSNHNYLVCGQTNNEDFSNPNPSYHLFLEEIDTLGQVLWLNSYGDSIPGSGGACVINTPDGGYAIAGHTNFFLSADLFFVKTDTTGFSGCNQFPLTFFRNNVTLIDSSGVSSQLVTLLESPLILNLSILPNISTQTCFSNDMNEIKFDNFKVFPNPANNFIEISSNIQIANVQIRNIVGQVVSKKYLSKYDSSIDISFLVSGVYFLEFNSLDSQFYKKFIKL